jgi:hypothetical protein
MFSHENNQVRSMRQTAILLNMWISHLVLHYGKLHNLLKQWRHNLLGSLFFIPLEFKGLSSLSFLERIELRIVSKSRMKNQNDFGTWFCCNTNSPGYHSSYQGERCAHTAFQTLTPNPGATKRQNACSLWSVQQLLFNWLPQHQCTAGSSPDD